MINWILCVVVLVLGWWLGMVVGYLIGCKDLKKLGRS